MAGAFTTVNLSQLSAPNVVEALDFETILAAMLRDLVARDPTFSALVESDPAYKILEVAAYRELTVRQRVNDAARAVMLAFAQKSDLDHIAANFNVERLLIQPADPTTIPPTPAVYEQDDEFRARIPLSLEAYTTAGSEGSYVFHGLSADGDVKDVSAISPDPGEVNVFVLSRTGDGTAPPQLLAAVNAALSPADIRPMTDRVTVMSASVVGYAVNAVLTIYPGPAGEVVLAAARAALTAYTTAMHRIGYDVTRSGLFRALHQPGVQNVQLVSPAADIIVDDGQAAFCTAVALRIADTTDV